MSIFSTIERYERMKSAFMTAFYKCLHVERQTSALMANKGVHATKGRICTIADLANKTLMH